MALTNSEKSTLRWSVKDCIKKGISEEGAIEKLRGNFKIATIKAYYRTFSPPLCEVDKTINYLFLYCKSERHEKLKSDIRARHPITVEEVLDIAREICGGFVGRGFWKRYKDLRNSLAVPPSPKGKDIPA